MTTTEEVFSTDVEILSNAAKKITKTIEELTNINIPSAAPGATRFERPGNPDTHT